MVPIAFIVCNREVEEGIPRRSDSWGSSTDLVVILEKLFPLI